MPFPGHVVSGKKLHRKASILCRISRFSQNSFLFSVHIPRGLWHVRFCCDLLPVMGGELRHFPRGSPKSCQISPSHAVSRWPQNTRGFQGHFPLMCSAVAAVACFRLWPGCWCSHLHRVWSSQTQVQGCPPSTHRCPNRVRSRSSNGKAGAQVQLLLGSDSVLSTRVSVKSSSRCHSPPWGQDSAHGESATMCKESKLEADVAKMTTINNVFGMWPHNPVCGGPRAGEAKWGGAEWGSACGVRQPYKDSSLDPTRAGSGQMLSASVSPLEK